MISVDSRPRFHIAVPFLDQDSHRVRLASSLGSILSQTALADGKATLRLTVASGRTSPDLLGWLGVHFPQVELDEKTDHGMYDGLARVFRDSEANFFGWLGAGDTYEPAAFAVVLENAPPGDAPYWITGLMRGRRSDGAIVRSFLPFRYRKRYFENGIHGTWLPTIQQESTFWNGRLHDRINFDSWATFRLAGDYFLWRTFSDFTEPLVVEAALGSFTWHGDNQSRDYEAYQTEVQSITRSPLRWERGAARLERGLWSLHPALKSRISGGHIRRFRWPTGPWVG